ncbi:protein of unknown function (DUF4332) [Candidatus Methanophagaceae archaeon]|nr:protein of unknown function (DUF4332) [Methanophagales archaeon]
MSSIKHKEGNKMDDSYYIDLGNFTIEKYKNVLEQAEMLPSRIILKEKIAERIQCLKENGIKNLEDLISVLKTTEKVKYFAKKSGLPEDYLLILRREVNSYQPKPVNLKKFPGVKGEAIEKLARIGIKNTKHLFEKVKTQKERDELAKQTNITNEELLELVKLTDISRVKWIGPIFARIFLDSGTDTVEKISKSTAENLFKELVEINNKKEYTKGNFTAKDVLLCINIAKDVPKAIKY